jgi:hypothetical protein
MPPFSFVFFRFVFFFGAGTGGSIRVKLRKEIIVELRVDVGVVV